MERNREDSTPSWTANVVGGVGPVVAASEVPAATEEPPPSGPKSAARGRLLQRVAEAPFNRRRRGDALQIPELRPRRSGSADQLAAEVGAGEQADEGLRQVLEAVLDVLAVL